MEEITKGQTTVKLSIVIILLGIALFTLPTIAKAADLSFSPSSGQYATNQALPIVVYVSSTGQSVNAVSGIIHFSADKLSLVSISKANSIISIWVQDPTFSNQTGTVNFEGIVLNPGFTGAFGNIITLNFKPISTGFATMKFSSGSVLANDGQGTNILKNLGNASFTIGQGIPPALNVPPVSTLIKEQQKNISQKINQAISQPSFYTIGSLIISLVVILIIIMALAFFFGFLLLFGWRRIRKDILALRRQNIMEERELADIKLTMRKSGAALNRNIQELKDVNAAEDRELTTLKSNLEDKTVHFEKNLQQLKDVNTTEDKDLAMLKLKLEDKTNFFERDLQQIKEMNAKKEDEIKKLKNKNILLEKKINESQEHNEPKVEETGSLQEQIENKKILMEKYTQELKEKEEEVARLKNGTKKFDKDYKNSLYNINNNT